MGLLVSLTDYKTWRNITGTAQDTALTQILTFVSADVRRWCDRDLTNGFESATRTEVYSGTNETTIQLNEWPVTSVTSVTQLWAGGSSEVLDSTTYRVNANTGLLSRIDAVRSRFSSFRSDGSMVAGTWMPEPHFTEGFFNFSIVYVGGYATIPGDLQQVVCNLADIAYASRGRDMTLKSENMGQYSWTAADAAQVAEIKANLLKSFGTGNT